ncbi:hypothetical protein L195_g063163, partial [Trifolium pratense]
RNHFLIKCKVVTCHDPLGFMDIVWTEQKSANSFDM